MSTEREDPERAAVLALITGMFHSMWSMHEAHFHAVIPSLEVLPPFMPEDENAPEGGAVLMRTETFDIQLHMTATRREK